MDLDEMWQAIDAQRLALSEATDHLAESEWERPSLCARWTVRDVAAHLTLQQLSAADVVRPLVRHPGGMKRSIERAARKRATLPTEQLVGGIRAMVGSRRHNVGVTPHETLIDMLGHGQDITVAPGRPLPVPPAAAAEAATRVWNTTWPFRARTRFRDFRPVATDASWEVGSGPRPAGPMTAILLVLTGRAAGAARLSGDGADEFRRRWTAPA
jgi:uncharacterized protein (TIGR03083 family)